MVATTDADDVHGVDAAGMSLATNCVVAPTQILVDAVTTGKPFTVINWVALQPVLFVYVIKAVPADTPVTTPALLTVAAPAAFETHAFDDAGVPVPVNCIADPAHTVVGPLTAGGVCTVIVAAAVLAALTQPAAFTDSA